MEIDILFEDDGWDEAGVTALAEAACTAALAELGLDPARFAVSILAAGDDRIAGLNAEFRGKPVPTNVLSWPAEERGAETPGAMPDLPDPDADGPPEELGDIALAQGVLAREAAEAGKPFDHHLAHLMVHGLLHLLGFDHIDDADAALMEGLETRILARLGVPDPY
ncbi:rRNA maturation RNase YbeY [Roseicyclus persicicus]|uniref:Endoribonuclease YbeY n=1 Tax=Roseicyclus persicicus TaxID=2650661 RepID=A0A7X6JXX6_9RHOB|nr:rRNA maturation RNase YbeY [Roseibacterium persicicum]NKX43228.1 rRNA maturation RNase YbeY [Roseibacterium persicicum]